MEGKAISQHQGDWKVAPKQNQTMQAITKANLSGQRLFAAGERLGTKDGARENVPWCEAGGGC